jgi:isopentenyl diphosphate isomerase/L-lactate dehydrogenase-like FMN-dependent dehydrogenase
MPSSKTSIAIARARPRSAVPVMTWPVGLTLPRLAWAQSMLTMRPLLSTPAGDCIGASEQGRIGDVLSMRSTLHVWKRRELSHKQIERVRNNGVQALIVTVDAPVSANREYRARNGFALKFSPTLRFALDLLRHPVWAQRVLLKYFTSIGFPHHENYPEAYRKSIINGVGNHAGGRANSFDWDDIKPFRDMWRGPLMLKAVNRPDPASAVAPTSPRRWAPRRC